MKDECASCHSCDGDFYHEGDWLCGGCYHAIVAHGATLRDAYTVECSCEDS